MGGEVIGVPKTGLLETSTIWKMRIWGSLTLNVTDLGLQDLLEDGCHRSGGLSITSSKLRVGSAEFSQKCVLRRLGRSPSKGLRVQDLRLKGLGSYEISGWTPQG